MCFVHDRRSLERVRIGLALNTVRTPLQKNFFGPFLQLNLVYWNFLSYRFDTVVLIQLAWHDRTIEEMKGQLWALCTVHCGLCPGALGPATSAALFLLSRAMTTNNRSGNHFSGRARLICIVVNPRPSESPAIHRQLKPATCDGDYVNVREVCR